jgi:hypothetical protein
MKFKNDMLDNHQREDFGRIMPVEGTFCDDPTCSEAWLHNVLCSSLCGLCFAL